MRLPSLLLSLLLSATLAPMLASCGEGVYPDEKLPAATQQGLNKAGCRVNGGVWLPYGAFLGPSAITVKVFPNRNQFDPTGTGYRLSISLLRLPVEGRSLTNVDTGIYLRVPTITGTGRFMLNEDVSGNAYGLFTKRATAPGTYFYTGSGTGPTGELLITRFDTVAKVVSGTFRFTATQKGTSEQISVKEGRFDTPFSFTL